MLVQVKFCTSRGWLRAYFGLNVRRNQEAHVVRC